MQRVEQKHATIMNIDVVAYSRMITRNARATIDSLLTSMMLMAALVGKNRGRVIDAVGDNLCAEFGRASDALRCAVQIQRALDLRNSQLEPDAQIHVRIGLDTGEVYCVGKLRFGDPLNIAARLQACADSDGVALSDASTLQLDTATRRNLTELGPRMLKNITAPVSVLMLSRGI